MNIAHFGPSGYENFFVLDCQNLPEFESLRSQLIAEIKDNAFGFEKNPSQPREFRVLVTSGSEKERSTLRPDAPFVSTNHCVAHFLKEPKIEVWRGYDERACTLLARVLVPFIVEHDITIFSDWGDDLTEHYRKYPWELLLGR